MKEGGYDMSKSFHFKPSSHERVTLNTSSPEAGKLILHGKAMG
jgi:hypothetical protein